MDASISFPAASASAPASPSDAGLANPPPPVIDKVPGMEGAFLPRLWPPVPFAKGPARHSHGARHSLAVRDHLSQIRSWPHGRTAQPPDPMTGSCCFAATLSMGSILLPAPARQAGDKTQANMCLATHAGRQRSTSHASSPVGLSVAPAEIRPRGCSSCTMLPSSTKV